MIVKGHEGHVMFVSTVFKVHHNQKLGDPLGHLGGGRTMAFGGIDAPGGWSSNLVLIGFITSEIL